MRVPVPEMCHPRKTMQRSVVSHVNSIFPCSVSLDAHAGGPVEAYIHVALGSVVHAGHVVAAVATMVHV